MHHFQIREDQLQINGIDVTDGVYAYGLVDILHHMHDIVIVKAAHHVHNGLAFTNMAQELVAQACALACALYKARNIAEFNDCRSFFICFPQLGQFVQAGIGHGHDAAVGLNGAERIVGRLCVLGAGECIKKGAFAHIGKPHDTEFHIYYISLIHRKNCVSNTDGFAAALSHIFCAAAKGPNATL